jgi:N-acetylneuraminate synthase
VEFSGVGVVMYPGTDRSIFEGLFVLEMANNHWGNLARGKEIVDQFAELVRHHEVRAAMKLQFRDVESFIHSSFKGNQDLRYIKKTEATRMTQQAFAELVAHIRSSGCIPMATPFDEASVGLCEEFEFEIIKVASSDHNDWPLLERISKARKPVIVSTGGASEKSLDDVVAFFAHRDIPLAINHCVSLYPSEDSDLQLSQITYLKNRYPQNVIGFSSHEQHDWSASMYLSYGLGARTWERHVDIEKDGVPVSPYCTLPDQAHQWFSAYSKSLEMFGNSETQRRVVSREEHEYLNALARGVYARKDLPEGYKFSTGSFLGDVYLAVPLQKGQLSTREILNGVSTVKAISKDSPLLLNHMDPKFFNSPSLRETIESRGV